MGQGEGTGEGQGEGSGKKSSVTEGHTLVGIGVGVGLGVYCFFIGCPAFFTGVVWVIIFSSVFGPDLHTAGVCMIFFSLLIFVAGIVAIVLICTNCFGKGVKREVEDIPVGFQVTQEMNTGMISTGGMAGPSVYVNPGAAAGGDGQLPSYGAAVNEKSGKEKLPPMEMPPAPVQPMGLQQTSGQPMEMQQTVLMQQTVIPYSFLQNQTTPGFNPPPQQASF